MLSTVVSRTRNPILKLDVHIKTMDLDFPSSFEEMTQALMEHILECHHCRFVVSAGIDISLQEAGCATCKQMFSRFHSELQVREALASAAHVSEEAIEEYCFNRLSAEEGALFEQHLRMCPSCAERVSHRREFIQCLKAALTEQAMEQWEPGALNGVLGIHVPERNLSLCAPILA